jgi:hypothetical protein
MHSEWWNECYGSDAAETPYYIAYEGTEFDELSRIRASGINDIEPGKTVCHLA